MGVKIGEPIRLYIQRGDGTVQKVSGTVSQISMHQVSNYQHQAIGDKFPVPIPSHVETNLTVIGDNFQTWAEDELPEEAESTRTAVEWRCDHCEMVNLRAHRRCDSCNFPRPFLYG
jgi:hypothetical protein